ncbi:Ras family protein [Trichuris suis]|nr:Ras family protein [Trichuris suis]
MNSKKCSNEEEALETLAFETARYFFNVCDDESKGYLSKSDMCRLLKNDMCNLSADELEMVFDSLDQDHNGKLTMEEFIRGFGSFVKSAHPEMLHLIERRRSSREVNDNSRQANGSSNDEYNKFLSRVGAKDIIGDTSAEYIWQSLRREPTLLHKFENMLETLGSEIKRVRDLAAKYKSNQAAEVDQLYADLEQQVKQETERYIRTEREKLKKLKWSMEAEIENKKMEFQELSQKYATVSFALQSICLTRRQVLQIESKLEDALYDKEKTQAFMDKLRKERDMLSEQREVLEDELRKSRLEARELSDYLERVQREVRDERKRRAVSAWNVNEEAAGEREALLRQLEALRTENIKLLDEIDASRHSGAASLSTSPMGSAKQMSLHRESRDSGKQKIRDMPYCQPEHSAKDSELRSLRRGDSATMESELCTAQPMENGTNRSDGSYGPVLNGQKKNVQNLTAADLGVPDRIFKVVVAGDSGVGKTSFLDRFTNDRFDPTHQSTIGIDFHLRVLKVEDQLIALQLWDTAGQERFRSITKQYFRKADAVILMFDLSSEQSFKNVRQWLSSVEEVTDENCIICIIGNKTDLLEQGHARIHREEFKPEEEYQGLYFEASAKTGDSVQEAMYQLALLLKDANVRSTENNVRLEESAKPKRSKCCGKSSNNT